MTSDYAVRRHARTLAQPRELRLVALAYGYEKYDLATRLAPIAAIALTSVELSAMSVMSPSERSTSLTVTSMIEGRAAVDAICCSYGARRASRAARCSLDGADSGSNDP
jgi:hypothetical protein